VAGKTLGFRVVTAISRPSHDLVTRFAKIRSADLSDAMQEANIMDHGLHPLYRPMACAVGPAVTIAVPRGCHFGLIKFGLQQTRSGDVVVVNARGDHTSAVIGGNISKALHARGVAGVVIDGSVRDTDEIRQIGLPVFTRHVTPNSGFAWGPGEVNVPIACGGVVVQPGDIIVADEDGIAVVPPWAAEAVFDKLASAAEKAAKRQSGLERGEIPDIENVSKKLVEEGCTISEEVG
jgi:4-hydroxy-4-methyl-2-oxoglutarate aldolase